MNHCFLQTHKCSSAGAAGDCAAACSDVHITDPRWQLITIVCSSVTQKMFIQAPDDKAADDTGLVSGQQPQVGGAPWVYRGTLR